MQRGNNERTQSRHDDEQTRGRPGSWARECNEVEAAALTYTRAAAPSVGEHDALASTLKRGGGDRGGATVAAGVAGTPGERADAGDDEFTEDATRRLPARRREADRAASPTSVRSADHLASSARTWSNSLRQSGSLS